LDEFIHSKDYENEDIFCIQFPKGGKLTVKLGQNFEKNGMYFYYQLKTNYGSSGSPILLLDNKKLIGIHKGIYIMKGKKVNIGIPIQLIINNINFIKCIYNINNNNIYKEIKIINSNDFKEGIIDGELIEINKFKKFNKEGNISIYFLQKYSLYNIEKMFYGCKYLEKVDLSALNFDNATNMSYMFSECSSLKTITFPSNIKNAYNFEGMFKNCSSLVEIDLSSFEKINIIDINKIFDGCSSLKKIKTNSYKNTLMANMINIISSTFEKLYNFIK